MGNTSFDVLGIGNAIVDVIARCDDAFLERHAMSKGHMQLIEADQAKALYADMAPAVAISGGSAAHTCAGVASFGGNVAFIGRVAQDQLGRIL